MIRLRNPTRREVKLFLAGLVLLVLIAQFVPVEGLGTNPPVVVEPAWDSPRTRELFFNSCVDCHSNQTVWPWYSRIAPVSWLVASDVEEGRRHLNVSEWNRRQRHAKDAAEEVAESEMPLKIYLIVHAEARLDAATRRELVSGLKATFGTKSPAESETAGGETD